MTAAMPDFPSVGLQVQITDTGERGVVTAYVPIDRWEVEYYSEEEGTHVRRTFSRNDLEPID